MGWNLRRRGQRPIVNLSFALDNLIFIVLASLRLVPGAAHIQVHCSVVLGQMNRGREGDTNTFARVDVILAGNDSCFHSFVFGGKCEASPFASVGLNLKWIT